MKTEEPARSSLCPAGSVWAELAAGLIPGPEVDRLLTHAAECNSCSATLQETLFLLGETECPVEVRVEESQVRELAVQMASRARRTLGQRLVAAVVALFAVLTGRIQAPEAFTRRQLVTAGAVLGSVLAAVVIPPSWFWYRQRATPPLAALAAAYSARRTIELRLPGAAYSPLRVMRSGGQVEAPPELLESQARIQRRLEREPADAAWLYAQGRAQVLQWQFDQAIRSFEAAEAAQAASADFWIDFATAYFERAEARAAAADYGRAAELLDRALQLRPRDPAALFNRGVVHSRQGRTDAAIRDLELCLQVETDTGWKEEAQRFLGEIRRRPSGGSANLL
jgi:tetratricopeptide (TPR) repeat protein